MPRLWMGKAPLKSKKRKEQKVKLLESMRPLPPGTNGVVQKEMAKPLKLGRYSTDGKMKEEILGEFIKVAKIKSDEREDLKVLATGVAATLTARKVEMNPSWKQWNLREFCKEKGIHVSAWSALRAYNIFWGSGAVMENQILKDIAMAKGKTIAQVALRWRYQQGSSAMVKSCHEPRFKVVKALLQFQSK